MCLAVTRDIITKRVVDLAIQIVVLRGELTNTDKIMNDTLWIGVYPGLTESMLDFVCEKIEAFFGVNFEWFSS